MTRCFFFFHLLIKTVSRREITVKYQSTSIKLIIMSVVYRDLQIHVERELSTTVEQVLQPQVKSGDRGQGEGLAERGQDQRAGEKRQAVLTDPPRGNSTVVINKAKAISA